MLIIIKKGKENVFMPFVDHQFERRELEFDHHLRFHVA